MSAEPVIHTAFPAVGEWWIRVRYPSEPGAAKAVRYDRIRIAAWAEVDYTDGYHGVEAMIAGDGPQLLLAREAFSDKVDDYGLEIFPSDYQPCTCGRRRGDDLDPRWCPECGAEIADGS